MDARSAGRAPVQHRLLHRRCTRPARVVAAACRSPGVGRAAERRPPRARRPRACRSPPPADHPEYRRAAPRRRHLARSADRDPWHDPRHRLSQLRRPATDAGDPRPSSGGRARSPLPGMRRHPEVGDRQLRPEPRSAASGPSRGRGGRLRPLPGGWNEPDGLPGCAPAGARAGRIRAPGDRQCPADAARRSGPRRRPRSGRRSPPAARRGAWRRPSSPPSRRYR